MKKLELVLVAAIISSSSALAQQTEGAAPFDFVWCETVEDVTARYGSLEAAESSPYRPDLETFLLSDWPEGSFPPDTVSVHAQFLRDGGLESLSLRTATFEDDDEGTEARRLFAALVDELNATWGEGSRVEVGPREPWPAADQFYQCALDGMCGRLSWSFIPADCVGTVVALDFLPEQRRVGHFTVKYIDPSATDCQ